MLWQQRSLLTYINRIYYPFMVREPELGCTDGIVWAVWLNSPYRSNTSSSSVRLGLALLLPTLDGLPAALNRLEDILCASGVRLIRCPCIHLLEAACQQASWLRAFLQSTLSVLLIDGEEASCPMFPALLSAALLQLGMPTFNACLRAVRHALCYLLVIAGCLRPSCVPQLLATLSGVPFMSL